MSSVTTLFAFVLLAVTSIGCAESSQVVPAYCKPHTFVGCSSAVEQWVWNGMTCEAIVECEGLGFVSRNDCLEAHTECGAMAEVEDACVGGCGEGAYVLIAEERMCAYNGGEAWRFTLAPRAETTPLGRDRGALLSNLAAPSRTIVFLLAVRDAFHDPQRVNVPGGGLEVALCGEGVDGCEVPSAGYIEVETGGAGEVRIELNIALTEGSVFLAPDWLSVRDTRGGEC